jgi:hypothetical protein
MIKRFFENLSMSPKIIRRLHNYPRLIFAVLWAAIGFDFLCRQGWQGGWGFILGTDFITLYGAGLLYRHNPSDLYDFQVQARIQESLIAPTPYPGLNPFISPPYVAMFYNIFNVFSLPVAFLIWNTLTLILVVHSTYQLNLIVNKELKSLGLTFWQMLILVLSFFPFALGWRVGQNHGLTLWLVTNILWWQRAGYPSLAGLLCGLLLYKPHFALGFLILWMVWKEWGALLSFIIVAILWVGTDLLSGNFPIYLDYIRLQSLLIELPWIQGFPSFGLITIYGLLATILPVSVKPILAIFSILQLLFLGILLSCFAHSLRNRPFLNQIPAWIFAILYPLVAAPYGLVHDLTIIIPTLVLWSAWKPSHRLLYLTIAIYLGSFFLLFVGALIEAALLALFPPATLILMICDYLFSAHHDKNV